MQKPITANPERKGITAMIRSFFNPGRPSIKDDAELSRALVAAITVKADYEKPAVDAVSVIEKAYQKNTYVWAAIRFIASRAASVPFNVYEHKADTEKKKAALDRYKMARTAAYADPYTKYAAIKEAQNEAIRLKAIVMAERKDHRIFDFLENPSDVYGGNWYDTIYTLVAFRELLGYVTPILRGSYDPAANYTANVYALKIPEMQYMAAVTNAESEITTNGRTYKVPYAGWNCKKPGQRGGDYYPSGKIAVWKYPSLTSEIYGDSPLRGAGMIPTAMLNELDEWQLTAMQGRGAFGGIVTVKDHDFTDQAEIDTETKRFNERLRQVKGGVVLMGNSIDYKQIAMKPTDYSDTDVTALGRRIALAFDLPSLVLGDMDKLNHSNYETAIRQAYQGKIIPVLDSLRDFLNANVTKTWKGNKYTIDYEVTNIEALNEDADRISKRAESQFKAGLITRNEGREIIGRSDAGDDTANMYYPELIAESRINPGALG